MQKECLLGVGTDGLRPWDLLWNLSGIRFLVQLRRHADHFGGIFYLAAEMTVITLSSSEYAYVRILDKE